MGKNHFLILNELYQSLKDEQNSLLEKVNKNLNRIEEMDLYIKSILEKEDYDYKVFSPRNIEVVYREQIDSCNVEKYNLENENKNSYKQINKIGRYLQDLSEILKENDEAAIPSINLQAIDIQEKERQRIARDLHDITLQNLTHLIYKIELSTIYIDQDPLRAKLELADISKNLKTAISDIRNVIFDLHPMSFDDLGLRDSLSNFFSNIENETDFTIESNIEEINCKSELVLLTIFRLIQEACMNAVYHSGGNILKVELKKNNSFYKIVIQDNGKGFKINDSTLFDKHHFGLTVMKERTDILNGKMEIISNQEIGTEIQIYLPIACQGD